MGFGPSITPAETPDGSVGRRDGLGSTDARMTAGLVNFLASACKGFARLDLWKASPGEPSI